MPLKLDPRETADLIAFLESLSSPPAPFRRTQVEAAQCDDDPPPPSPRAAVGLPAALTPTVGRGSAQRRNRPAPAVNSPSPVIRSRRSTRGPRLPFLRT